MNNKSRKARLFGSLILAQLLLPAALAANSDEFTAADEHASQQRGGTVVSNEALNIGTRTAYSLSMRAEEALRDDEYDKAIKLCKQSLDIDDDDVDVRVTYARALERKLQSQKQKDSYVFTECVKQWLTVLRNEVGDEKGVTFKGLSILNINSEYGDSDRFGLAKAHLKKVAGAAPRPWETDNMYLSRIMAKNVEGQIVVDKEKQQPK